MQIYSKHVRKSVVFLMVDLLCGKRCLGICSTIGSYHLQKDLQSVKESAFLLTYDGVPNKAIVKI